MKRYAQLTVLLIAVAMLGGLVAIGSGWSLWACESDSGTTEDANPAESETPVENEKGEEAKTVSIPLEKIYTTSTQEGLQPLPVIVDKPAPDIAKDLRDLFGLDEEKEEKKEKSFESHLVGALDRANSPEVFLVYGDSIQDAMRVTLSVFAGYFNSLGHPVEARHQPESRQAWVVVYLGLGTFEPPRFLIASAVRDNEAIRVSFRHNERRRQVFFSHFLYLIPVGEIAPGELALELFDEDRKTVVLMRSIKALAK